MNTFIQHIIFPFIAFIYMGCGILNSDDNTNEEQYIKAILNGEE